MIRQYMLAAALAAALYNVSAAVETRTVEVQVPGLEEKLMCFLAVDTGKVEGKAPAVLIFPEWWGLNDYAKSRARQLAELGYVAMAMDVYGGGKTTPDPEEAGKLSGAIKSNTEELRKRVRAALRDLKKQPEVDGDRIGATGYCFGGWAALEMARSGANLDAVVSFHGALKFSDPVTTNSVKAKILVLHGADDPMVPPAEVQQFRSEMDSAGVPLEFEAYEGAVHSFTNPDAGKKGIPGVEYNASADKKSWERMKEFLSKHLNK